MHVPCGETRPVGPTLHVNARPDRRRPVHVHDAALRGAQATLSIVSPCLPAITRAYSAACPAGVLVPKHPASNSAGANATAARRAATTGVSLRRGRPVSSRGPITSTRTT